MSRLTDKDWKNPDSLMWMKLGIIEMRDEGYRRSLGDSLMKLARYEDVEERLIEEYGVSFEIIEEKWKEFTDNIAESIRYRTIEEQGRLVELPCKVRDRVYSYCEELGRILEYHIETIMISCHPEDSREYLDFEAMCIESAEEELIDAIDFTTADIGKSVFLTYEAAEAKLKEMEGTEE